MGHEEGAGRPSLLRAEVWPLVGRQSELAVLQGMLRAEGGGVCLLTGPAGVGKSRLAAEALDRAGRKGHPTLRANGNPALADLPLGLFAAHLPPQAETGEGADPVRRVAQVLAAGKPGPEVSRRWARVILVDDAHHADDQSLAVLEELVASGRVVLWCTTRTGAADPATAARLERLATQELSVEPIPPDAVDGLLASVLGGPVERTGAYWLATHSGGNPLFLRELVLSAAETGALALEDGRWRLQPGQMVSARLIELIGARMWALPESEKEAIALIAHGEPMGLAEAETLVSAATVADLTARGLVTVDLNGPRRTVRLEHPLYGDVVRARTPVVLARRIKRVLAGVLEATAARRGEDPLRIGVWRLESGSGADSPTAMLTAARIARRRGDPVLAERLAGVAVAGGAGFDAELLQAQLWFLLGRPDEARERLEALVAGPTADDQRVQAVCTLIDVLAMAFGATDDALRVGAEAAPHLVGAGGRDEVEVRRAQLLMQAGQVDEPLRLLDPLLGRVEGRAFVSAALTATMCLTLAGRFEAAAVLADQGFIAR